MRELFILIAIFAFQSQEDLPVLSPGDSVKGTIENGEPVVHTEILDKDYSRVPSIGRRYILELSEPGLYTVELKSLFFDAYLVLVTKEDKVLSENNDGFYGTHSRMTIEAINCNEVYFLYACALHGDRGIYELKLTKGKSTLLSPFETESHRIGNPT